MQKVKGRALTLVALDRQIAVMKKIAERPEFEQIKPMAAAIISLQEVRDQVAIDLAQAEHNLLNQREVQREVSFTRVLAEMIAFRDDVEHQEVYGVIACALLAYIYQRADKHLKRATERARKVARLG